MSTNKPIAGKAIPGFVWRFCALYGSIFCSFMLCALPLRAAAGAGPNVPSGPVHGLWIWKSPAVLGAPHGAEMLRDFCRSESVNEVYLSYSSKTAPEEEKLLAHAIGLLHASKVHVEALLSSADADEPGKHRDKLLDEARQIVQFNQAHPGSRFDGIHLDVEPQQRPENKGAGNLKFLPDLVDAFRAVRAVAEPAGMTVNADIQMKLLKGDAGQRKLFLSAVPRVTLMMYELSSPGDGKSAEEKAEAIGKDSKKYLDMAFDGLNEPENARKVRARMRLATMAIALRTPDYGALLPQMLKKLDDSNGTNPHYLGWARHSYNDSLQAGH